jgi:hypothetical protein
MQNKTSLLTPDPPPIPAFMTTTTSSRSRSLAPGQAYEDSTLARKLKTMRASLLILLFGAFLAVRSNAAPMTHEVSVKLGPKRFLDGDSVRIDSVTSTSPSLEPGDTVMVTGKYRLDSHEEATLALYLTQTEGNGIQETDPTQKSAAKRGWHKFTSVITVKYRGLLHLTFYDCTSGKPFGGVYFGTPKQIDSDHSVSVDHYPTKR